MLPETTVTRIKAASAKYHVEHLYAPVIMAFHDGATAEATRSMILLEALEKAVLVITAWHNADEVWEIYYTHAPEMKPIREAIASYNNQQTEL